MNDVNKCLFLPVGVFERQNDGTITPELASGQTDYISLAWISYWAQGRFPYNTDGNTTTNKSLVARRGLFLSNGYYQMGQTWTHEYTSEVSGKPYKRAVLLVNPKTGETANYEGVVMDNIAGENEFRPK